MRSPIADRWQATNSDKLVTCKRCGAMQLAWVQSRKTSRYYLVQTTSLDQYGRMGTYADRTATHDCDRYTADRDAHNAGQDEREARARKFEMLLDLIEAYWPLQANES